MKKADWILILCILLAAGAAALWVSADKGSQDNGERSVVVTVDGEVYRTLSLSEAQELCIPTADGDSILVIDENACYMKSAHCPDQICVKHKRISTVGESIICLPYKIIVTIEGNGEAAYDN